ncbi:MAG TPA: hypothetical protein VJ351_01130 [Streptosporangiaceae bacterium]|nr:hypothetical protein [Streptosporangiaceae bacterium]
MSGPGPYGPGRRSEPREVPGGRREVPFGPDVSWPNGFQQMDPESRRLLESGYGRSVDPGYGTGGRGPGYRDPAADDYGDPGYSDPSYDGPRGGSAGRSRPDGNRGSRAPGGSPAPDGSGHGSVPGYHVPDYRGPSRPDLGGFQQGFSAPGIYPVTGAQEALPATGPQPVADTWPGSDSGSARSGRPAYPEQWYDHPRLDDSRRGGARPDSPPAPDPRLEGMRYDELRYDEPLDVEPRYDEPLDADAWVKELRRGAPTFPQPPSGPSGSGPSGSAGSSGSSGSSGSAGSSGGSAGPAGGSSAGDQRRGDLSGWGQQPAPGQSGWGQQPASGQSGGYPQAFGYGQGRDDRGGPAPRGPRMSGGQPTSPLPVGPRPPAAPQDRAFPGDTYYGAPTAQVGVLTPPATRRLDDPLDTGPHPVTAPAAPNAGQVLAPQVRPGHGLDGPEITSSWPAQPQVEETESFEEFWAEDDNDAEYEGLFPGEDPDFDARRKASTRTKAEGRRTGRRRGRSNDHRLWLALLGVLIVAAAAIFGILKFEFPSHGGPAHHMATPARIGSYVRTVDMEKETKVNQLRAEVIKMSSGQASNVVSAVYESGNSAAGNTEQIVMFIGGHLANAAPASSIASFTQKFSGASVVSAGALGGKAACVEEAPGTSDSVAMCVWFDNDSFGEIVSPTMNAHALAGVMRTMRPSLEIVVKK